MLNIVEIYTDGSCIYNPGPGGCAAIVKFHDSDKKKVISYGFYYTTNNRMELMAAILSLQYLLHFFDVDLINLFTDSNYLFSGINFWMCFWKKNNWKNANNKLIKNIDLWSKLDSLFFFYKSKIRIHLIKSHNGNFYNEECDKIAFLSAKKPFLNDLFYIKNVNLK